MSRQTNPSIRMKQVGSPFFQANPISVPSIISLSRIAFVSEPTTGLHQLLPSPHPDGQFPIYTPHIVLSTCRDYGFSGKMLLPYLAAQFQSNNSKYHKPPNSFAINGEFIAFSISSKQSFKHKSSALQSSISHKKFS